MYDPKLYLTTVLAKVFFKDNRQKNYYSFTSSLFKRCQDIFKDTNREYPKTNNLYTDLIATFSQFALSSALDTELSMYFTKFRSVFRSDYQKAKFKVSFVFLVSLTENQVNLQTLYSNPKNRVLLEETLKKHPDHVPVTNYKKLAFKILEELDFLFDGCN